MMAEVFDSGRRRALQAVACAPAWPLLAGAKENSPLLHKRIPSSGERIPAIGLDLGRTQLEDPWTGERVGVGKRLSLLANLPGAMVDTSVLKPRLQTSVGKALTRVPGGSGLFMSFNLLANGGEEAAAQLRRAEVSLQRERLDLVQVQNLRDWQRILPLLQDWKVQGRIRYVGVRHYHHSVLDTIEDILQAQTLDFIQISYSLVEREAEKSLLARAAEQGVAVIADRPFSGGYLNHRVRGKQLPDWAVELGCNHWSQLFIKYLLANPAVTCINTPSANGAQLATHLKASMGEMPDAAMLKRMRQLAGTL